MDKKEYPERVKLYQENGNLFIAKELNIGVEYLRADKGEEVDEKTLSEYFDKTLKYLECYKTNVVSEGGRLANMMLDVFKLIKKETL